MARPRGAEGQRSRAAFFLTMKRALADPSRDNTPTASLGLVIQTSNDCTSSSTHAANHVVPVEGRQAQAEKNKRSKKNKKKQAKTKLRWTEHRQEGNGVKEISLPQGITVNGEPAVALVSHKLPRDLLDTLAQLVDKAAVAPKSVFVEGQDKTRADPHTRKCASFGLYKMQGATTERSPLYARPVWPHESAATASRSLLSRRAALSTRGSDLSASPDPWPRGVKLDGNTTVVCAFPPAPTSGTPASALLW